jgi:hypothetical protein
MDRMDRIRGFKFEILNLKSTPLLSILYILSIPVNFVADLKTV